MKDLAKWEKTVSIDEGPTKWWMHLCAMPQNSAYSAEEVRWRDYQRGITSPAPDCGRCGEQIPNNDKPQFMVIISPPAIFNRNCRHGPFCSRCTVKLSRATIPFCALCRAVSAPSKLAEVCNEASNSISESYASNDSGSNVPRSSPKRHKTAGCADAPTVLPRAELLEDKKKLVDALSEKMTSLVSKLGANPKTPEIVAILRLFDLKDQNVAQALRHWCQSNHSLSLDLRVRRSIIKLLDATHHLNGQSGTSSSSGTCLTSNGSRHTNNNDQLDAFSFGKVSAKATSSAADCARGSNEVRPSSSDLGPCLESDRGKVRKEHTPTHNVHIGTRKRSREGESTA
eukprot:GEMP01042525.1.p1 GENE.GEMP01042525.1~~GEMP01042525.1.p1  ORF type:complete len:342 (+),score=59.82 GEMP01042525.1:56-1081(+)